MVVHFYVIANYSRRFIHKTSKNLNRVHKDSNEILSVIITLVTDIHGGETVFDCGMTITDIGKRAHVIKHSHSRFVVIAFYKNLHEGSIWIGHRAVLSFILHKSTFLYFVHHGTKIYDRYIYLDDRNIYIADDGSAVFPEQRFRNLNLANIRRHIVIEVMFFTNII